MWGKYQEAKKERWLELERRVKTRKLKFKKSEEPKAENRRNSIIFTKIKQEAKVHNK